MPPAKKNNPSALKGKGVPKHKPPDPGEVAREKMGYWARWSVTNRQHFTYTEGASRWHMVQSNPGSLPQFADCSSFVTGLAKWAGASDPNGLGFRYGYTGTLLKHCNGIEAAVARMADLVVFGPGTGSHAAFVLEALPHGDFYLVSHGKPGDPSRVLYSQMLAYFNGSSRFLRFLS